MPPATTLATATVDRLISAAGSHDEMEVINAAIGAGLMWRCLCGATNALTDGECDLCAAPRPWSEDATPSRSAYAGPQLEALRGALRDFFDEQPYLDRGRPAAVSFRLDDFGDGIGLCWDAASAHYHYTDSIESDRSPAGRSLERTAVDDALDEINNVDTPRVGDTLRVVVPAPSERLNAAHFADEAAAAAMVRHWSRAELYALGNVLFTEADRRIEGELLEVLRIVCAGQDEGPVAQVEFVTNPNYEDGIYWDEHTIWLHIAGRQEPVQLDIDGTSELEQQFCQLMADYSCADRPENGAHLVVDLGAGTFTVSGKWSPC